MKYIELTQGKRAIVDDADHEWLSQWKWTFLKGRRVGRAYRMVNKQTILMHRLIMDVVDSPREVQVDHINLDSLDNRRSNLRVCDNGENNRNRPKQSNNTSGHKGVSWDNYYGKWKAQLNYNGKKVLNKYFLEGELDKAIEAYQEAAKKYHGSFARF